MKPILTSCRRMAVIAWPYVAIAMLLVPLFLACGCKSGTKEIARAASNTDTLTATIDDHSRALRPIVGDNPEGVQHIDGIEQATRDIRVETRKVHEALPKVKDVTPWWATLLGNGFIVAGVVAVFGLLVYLGLGPLIARAVAFLASFIPAALPRAKREDAKLDFESLEANPESPEIREKIAARRARDVQYDAAWKAMKREEKAAPAPDVKP